MIRRLPWGVLGMIPLVVLVEGFLASRWLDLTPHPTLSWRLSEEALRSPGFSPRVLYLGDSLMKHGVLPAVVESTTGKPGHSLATSAAQAPSTLHFFAESLARGARPEAVVVDYSPDLMLGPPRELIRSYPEVLSVFEIVELARDSRDFSFAVECLAAKALTSVKARFEIRDLVRDRVFGDGAGSLRPTSRMLARNWEVNQGAQFTPDRPEYHGEVGPEDVRKLNAKIFWCHRVNRRHVEKLLDLAEREGVKVYWLLTPVVPELRKVRAAAGSDAKHTAFVEAIMSRRPSLTVVDAREAGFSAEHFVDPIHLNGRGALALSRMVGRVVRDGRTGWVRPEPVLDESGAEALEDLHKSLRVVTGGGDGAVRR